MLAERKFVSQVAVEHVGHIVIAKPVILVDVVSVLLERHIGTGLTRGGIAVSAVVTLIIRQTFRPRVIQLERQPAAQTALEGELESIVVLPANRRVESYLSGSDVLESGVARQVRSGNRGSIREKHPLARVDDRRQMIGVLPDVGR